MADKKFSQFNSEADINNFDGVVGYQGVNNVRISGADLNSSLDINSYPPLPSTAFKNKTKSIHGEL